VRLVLVMQLLYTHWTGPTMASLVQRGMSLKGARISNEK
jgi:hypothetical protein